MLCLAGGWQALVGPDGVRPEPSAARPHVQGAGYILQGGQVSHQPPKANGGAAPAEKPAVLYAQLPLSFEANQGQTDKQVKFLSRGRGYGLFLTGDEAVLELQDSGSRIQDSGPRAKPFGATSALQGTTDNGRRTTKSALRLKLVHADRNAAVAGANELPGKVNYFLGNDPKKWRTNVPTYAQVRYRNVYPGIDLVYYGNQIGQLEYDFVVAAGADPGAITLGVEAQGQERNSKLENRNSAAHAPLQIAPDGDLAIPTGGGELRFHKPVVYQQRESEVRSQESGAKNPQQGVANNRKSPITNRKSVEARFLLDAQNRVRFALGPYDHTQPLVIDPVLVYSTYLGGSRTDSGSGIAVDSSGNTYVTGVTDSTNFPTANPLQARLAGEQNVFVAKLNPAGSALVYSTYLGGSDSDEVFGIAVDSSGNAYVTGKAGSPNFPTTPGAFQTTLGSASNAFVAKLNPTGSALVYSTFLGGSGGEYGFGITVDSSGNAYVTGSTSSTNFPTANPLQASLAGEQNAFVAKLNPTGSALVYSTYLGGSSIDTGDGIAVDSSGDAYVTGVTGSSDFPTANPLQASLVGTSNAFVAKLNWSGSALSLVYSTYLGGGGDAAEGIALDTSGSAYVTGYTTSPVFPTANPIQSSLALGALFNPFVAKLNPEGTALVYSTYLGGSGAAQIASDLGGDMGNAIAVDSIGNACVTGWTASSNFPTANPLQASLGGNGARNAFVAKLSWTGSALSLAYSTYLGGSTGEEGSGIAVDSSGNAYVTGGTDSSNFPTANPLQASLGGINATNAFVAKIGAANSPGIAFGPGALTFPVQIVGTPSASQSVTLTAAGSQPLILAGSATSGDFAFATTDTSCPYSGGTVPSGDTCTIDVTFTPTATGTRNGSVTINDNASGSPQSVKLAGTGVSTAPVASISTSSLSFGGQLLNTTSAAQPVTLSNTGNVPLTVIGISTSGDFGETDNCSVSLAAGHSCTINITFTPQLQLLLPPVPSTLTGTLTITDNSRNTTGSIQTVSLSGTWEDFALTVPSGYSSTATVPPGEAAAYTLSVLGEGGFNQPVTLTCGGFPSESTCAVSPNSVAPGSNFTVIVATTAPSATAPRTFPPARFPGPQALMMLAAFLAALAWTIRRWRQDGASRRRTLLAPLAAGLLLALALAACGGRASNYYPGTPPGTYTVTVTGTVGSGSTALSRTLTLTLTVS